MRIEAYKRMYEVQCKHWWWVGKANIVESEVQKALDTIPQCGLPSVMLRLLDVGCGCGHMLNRLNKYGIAYGTDISEEAVAFSNLTFPNDERVKIGYLPDGIPFTNEQFDIVTALDVLEHIANDKKSAKTLIDLLKPGGTLIATVPAYMSLWSNHDLVLQHKRRYTKNQFISLFDNLGCKIVKSTCFNSILLPTIWIVRKLGNLFRSNHMETDDRFPGTVINSLFSAIMQIEHAWLRKHTFPVGVSIMVVIKKGNSHADDG